jgi:hypothetical protein
MPNPNTTFTAGAILTADQQNRLPWGVVGYAQKAADQSITTQADIASLTATFTAVAGRVYKFTATLNMFTNSTSDMTVYLNNNSVNVKESLGTIATNTVQTRTFVWYQTGITAGSKTYKLRAAATNSTVVYGSSIRAEIASQFIVEDIGPA